MQKNKMGILRDKANSLKNDPWYKKLRRWIKFKLWLWKNGINDLKHNILNGCFNLNDGIYVSLEVGSGN
jgi:hypothetical protein